MCRWRCHRRRLPRTGRSAPVGHDGRSIPRRHSGSQGSHSEWLSPPVEYRIGPPPRCTGAWVALLLFYISRPGGQPGSVVTGSETSGFGHGDTNLLDADLTHTEFLYLAGHRHRKIVHEFEMPGSLEVSDAVLAVVTQLLRIGIFVTFQFHPGDNFLAVLIVGNTNHLDVGHGGMGVEKLL